MGGLRFSEVAKAAEDVGIENVRMVAEIIRMIIELQDNSTIVEYLQREYGVNGKGAALRRKFNSMVQSYIIHNFYDEFLAFCGRNGISIFNEDLDVTKESASYARVIFVVFLREVAGLRPEIPMVDDVADGSPAGNGM
jgi:hypothetical protein